jgi:hypothetical protein
MDERTKLYIFDFDGTLFRSPGPRPDHTQPAEDWFPGSLGDESGVPKKPNENWYLQEAVESFKRAQRDPFAYVAVVTGRWPHITDDDGNITTDFETRVRELLDHMGMFPDSLHMKDPEEYGIGTTHDFKRDMAQELLEDLPAVTSMQVYDDNDNHRRWVADAALKAGLRHVKDCSPPFEKDDCEPSEEVEQEWRPPDRHKSDRTFHDFLDEFYEGGKMMVPNLNPETKDRYPEVEARTLLKSYPPYAQQLTRRYRRWINQGAPKNRRRRSPENRKAVTSVARAWLLGDKKC